MRTIVATPHAFKGPLDVPVAARDAALAELRRELQERAVELTVVPGYECQLSEHLLESMLRSPDYTLGCRGRAFLLELPDEFVPAGLDVFLFEAQLANLIPVLVHPERNREVQKRPALLSVLVDRGLHLQVNARSLTGQLGWRARRTAKKLLANGWVYAIASDSHNATVCAPCLSRALAVARKVIGASAVELVEANPARLLQLRR